MISYAGILLPVQTNELALQVERTISPSLVYDFSTITWPGNKRQGWTFQGQIPRRAIRPGTLYWPQGAGRWAVAYFVVDGATLTLIRSAVAGSPLAALPLVMTFSQPGGPVPGVGAPDTTTDSITTNLWMLPPRPLQQFADLPVYLITLVDDRFWWQYANTDDLVITGGTTTWANLYSSLATSIGITITADPINAAYLTPSGTFQSRFQSATAALDVVAYNCGQRLVRRLDGTVLALNVTTSQTVNDANLAALATSAPMAGGQFLLDASRQLSSDAGLLLPSSVVVTFTRAGVNTDEVYPVTVTLASLVLPEYAGVSAHSGVKFFRDTAKANYLGQVSTPSNATELTTMANRVATDWYRYQTARQDLKMVGIRSWIMDGLTDSVEWTYRAKEGSTRIQRPPFNDLVEDLLHESSCLLPLTSPFPAQITSGTDPYAWQEMTPSTGGGFSVLSGGRTGTASVNPAYEINGNGSVPENAFVWMFYGHYVSPATQDYVFQSSSSSLVGNITFTTNVTWTFNALVVWNINFNFTWNIAALTVVQIGGPGFLYITAPLEICGTQFWCCQTFTLTSSSNEDLAIPGGATVVDVSANNNASTIGGIVPQPFGGNVATGAATAATNASPIVITVPGWITQPLAGQAVLVSNINGNTAANGTYSVQASTGTTLTLLGSTGNGAFTASPNSTIQLIGPQLLVLNNTGTNSWILNDTTLSASRFCNQIIVPPVYGHSIRLSTNDSATLWWDECFSGQWRVIDCTVQPFQTGVTATNNQGTLSGDYSVTGSYAFVGNNATLTLAANGVTWLLSFSASGVVQGQSPPSVDVGELLVKLVDTTNGVDVPGTEHVITYLAETDQLSPLGLNKSMGTASATVTYTPAGSSNVTIQIQAKLITVTGTPAGTIRHTGDGTTVITAVRIA